jgi:DNA-directed RNA polymerase specialized sigma24 family protein
VPNETLSWDAQDTRDRELLARGAIEELLAAYVELIRARCRNRCGAHGDDVAQQACLRLWRELSDGKHRDGIRPFREIVTASLRSRAGAGREPRSDATRHSRS